ncbi:group III truncated hemoglobin [Arthrobacter sp. B3I4]|uniref:group III truncated hemoglobin n=1 Tax=Arthrobacter sp. B3I4 TaxID=3042267 RepID=UPI00278583FB|nr:group III truncated hemoglobin [Arthrobacter sp. B3I4]MDQ0757111.1 hemoglobin [Arthrobacter sp. B3I4]
MNGDLQDRSDVARLVDDFYRRAFADPLIGPIFTDVAKMDLDRHLPIMCDFWETVLFRAGLYRRNALQAHLDLSARFPLRQEHFERWLALWVENVDEHFAGEKAELAKIQAARIAGSIHRRLEGRSGSDFETLKPRSQREGEPADARRV